ncbi:MAG: hypothetical protein IJU79_03465 [Desulfovibrionaceae bacterium]|nr:hypothetical protein [Desulfovibrionaceae bacterium]
MSEMADQNRLTETAYQSEAWHYRHAVVTGIIIFFSIFYLFGLGIWNAVIGFISGIHNGWLESVKPFISQASETVPAEPTDTTTESTSEQK